jgi:hypothetical protein
MKKIMAVLLSSVLFIAITACQENPTNSDTAKLQDAIDKIKTKIQENLNNKSEVPDIKPVENQD